MHHSSIPREFKRNLCCEHKWCITLDHKTNFPADYEECSKCGACCYRDNFGKIERYTASGVDK